MFVPASTKRPHWVLLGFESTLRRPQVCRPIAHRVLGRRMVSFTDRGRDELQVLDDVCPHRGASLAQGTVADTCIVCPYHGLEVGQDTYPHKAYDHAILQGFVWVDIARNLITQFFMPPYFPQLADLGSMSECSRPTHANALAIMEDRMDLRRIARTLGSREAHSVDLLGDGPDGHAASLLDTRWGPVKVRVRYSVPFTTCLTLEWAGAVVAHVVTSVLPESPTNSIVHTRVHRSQTPCPFVNAATQPWHAGDEALAGTVDGYAWSASTLDASQDALLVAYRNAMRRLFPDVVAYLACTP